MADETPQLKLNIKQVDPSMTDVLNLWKKDTFLNLNCHHLGTVQSFDSDQQTATCTINYKKTQYEKDSAGVYKLVLKDYPILVDMPVIILSGGTGSLTFPIAAGDECLILFNDRSIDNWFQSGQVRENSSSRLHSFSDGLVLIGVRSLISKIPDYDTERVVLANGTTKIAFGDKVEISNDANDLNTLLQNLVTTIKAITTTLGDTVSASSQTALTTAATNIAALLGDT